LTTAIGVGAGRGAAGFGATRATAFLAAFFFGAARFLAGRLALAARFAGRLAALRATARFFAFGLDFPFAFLFFLAM
jgi:hypothetical protein